MGEKSFKDKVRRKARVRYFSGNVVIGFSPDDYPFCGYISVLNSLGGFNRWSFKGLTVEHEGTESPYRRATRKILAIALKYTSDKRPEKASRWAPSETIANLIYENYVIMDNGMAYIDSVYKHRFGRQK
ncbi:MAG: hypothetical protein HN929_03500 [Chloroflexi bacterium]|jgi:hypothetical protein|nr:hypothetical protein [Chloroflexota bacterium]